MEAVIFQASDHSMLGYGKMQVHANNKKVNLLKEMISNIIFHLGVLSSSNSVWKYENEWTDKRQTALFKGNENAEI